MLNFFRTNQILAALFYLLYMLPFLAAVWFEDGASWQKYSSEGWLFQVLMAGWGSSTMSNLLLCALFLFFTALLLSQMVIDRQLDRILTLFPGLFFILTACAMPGHLHFSAMLPAMLFFLLSIWQLLKVYKKYAAVINLFDAGFWLGVASLFVPQFSLLLLWEWLLLNKLRAPMKTRDLLGLTLGWLSPNFILGSYLYLQGSLSDFINTQFTQPLTPQINGTNALWSAEWLTITVSAVFLLFFFQTPFKKKEIGKKKIIQAFYELLVFIVLITIFFPAGTGFLQLAALPLGVLFALTFSQWPAQTAEGLHLMLYIAGLFLLYAPYISL